MADPGPGLEVVDCRGREPTALIRGFVPGVSDGGSWYVVTPVQQPVTWIEVSEPPP